MRLRDRIRTESAVQRVQWRLPWTLSDRRRREIVRELRGHLDDAAAAEELDEALERLGDARALADAYADEEQRRRFLWPAGIIAALVAHLGVTVVLLVAAMAFSAGVEAGLDGGQRSALWPALAWGEGVVVEDRSQPNLLIASWELLTPVHLTAMALAFLAWSRPWRLLRSA